MVTPLLFFATPAIHPRLTEADEIAILRAAWRDGGSVRVADALAPGLAAELAAFATAAPVEPRMFAEQLDVSWSCDVHVDRSPDPQHPQCLYRFARFLETDLPAFVSRVVGRPLVTITPHRLHVWMFRKGSHVDAGASLAPRGGLDVFIGLTGPSWPPELGGQLELLDATGAVVEQRRPGWDALDIIDGQPWRVSLVQRHVEMLMLRVAMGPGRND